MTLQIYAQLAKNSIPSLKNTPTNPHQSTHHTTNFTPQKSISSSLPTHFLKQNPLKFCRLQKKTTFAGEVKVKRKNYIAFGIFFITIYNKKCSMEENVDPILGVEPTDTPKPPPPPFPHQRETQPTSAEKVLNTFANIILVIGVVATLITCLIGLTSTYAFLVAFYSALGVLCSILFAWAFLKLLVQIAQTLREINSKLK